MEEFYRNWFTLQGIEVQNPEYELPEQQHNNDRMENETPGSESESESENRQSENSILESESEPRRDENVQISIRHLSGDDSIAYETPQMTLIVKKGIHKRQKIFRLLDQMFYFRIEPKNQTAPPLLSSILDSLHAALIFVINDLRKKFKEEDHNVCYLTLFQRPMLSGLNTGSFDLADPGINSTL